MSEDAAESKHGDQSEKPERDRQPREVDVRRIGFSFRQHRAQHHAARDDGPGPENNVDSKELAAQQQASMPSTEVAAIGKVIADLNGKVQAYQKLAQSMDKTSTRYAKLRENYPKLSDEAVELLWQAKEFGHLVRTWTADPHEYRPGWRRRSCDG